MLQEIHSAAEMQAIALALKREGKTIGLCPTMGYLHAGHLSLAKAARAENDVVVMSIFVNPIQFGPNEDYAVYPRDMAHDKALVEDCVDYIFAPQPEDMYPEGFHTEVAVHELTRHLCGASRPGHFNGVSTVVSKLFNIVQPDRAYFGQKDAQQLAVIRRMVRDLNFPLEIVPMPIVREADGLALSSRNRYLSAEERQQALILNQSLQAAAAAVAAGERDAKKLTDSVRARIQTMPLAEIDYVELVDEDMQPAEDISGWRLLALAVRFGKTRLIDNIVLEAN